MRNWLFTSVLSGLILVGSAGAALSGSALPNMAGKSPVLVELYTSQGCSSCPLANRYLSTLLDRPDVVPLSFAVDYWDYLGWKDTYASRAFTQRQFDYTHALHERRPFTPQFIIGGTGSEGGTDPARLDGMIAGRMFAESTGPALIMRREGNNLAVNIGASQTKPRKPVGIYLVYYQPGVHKVHVERGENAGHDLIQVNMVTRLARVGNWDGAAQSLSLPAPETGAAALILQESGPGRVVAVTREVTNTPMPEMTLVDAVAPETK